MGTAPKGNRTAWSIPWLSCKNQTTSVFSLSEDGVLVQVS